MRSAALVEGKNMQCRCNVQLLDLDANIFKIFIELHLLIFFFFEQCRESCQGGGGLQIIHKGPEAGPYRE